MKSAYFLAAGVLVAILSAIVLMVILREPPAGKVEHGSFSNRFQPMPPQTSKEGERIAGIGSIRDLQPVRIEPR